MNGVYGQYVAQLFKEWKSHANLRAFSTAKTAIVEGLIWAAIVVAAVKRYLAHSAQIIAEVACWCRHESEPFSRNAPTLW